MTLNLTIEGHTAWLVFDHGKANEMGRAQLDALDALCDQLEADPQVRALITYSRRVTGRGTPIFVAGANVTERRGWSRAQTAAHVRDQRRILSRVRSLPLLHVVVVHGVALGWGCEFLIAADYRIATPSAQFALPETGLGIVPGAGGTSELSALIGLPQALRLGMTGESINGEEAARIGLVQEVAPSLDEGLARARALADAVSRRSPTAVAAFKRAALGCVGAAFDDRVEVEAMTYEFCLNQGEADIGRDNFERITRGDAPAWPPRKPFPALTIAGEVDDHAGGDDGDDDNDNDNDNSGDAVSVDSE
jgi:enoyl-CoA hydratase/carnithine racemase